MPVDAAIVEPIEPSARVHLVTRAGALVGESAGRALLRTIGAELHVHDNGTRDRLLAAVRGAIDDRAAQVLLVGGLDTGRRLVLVRPASRYGLAAVVVAPMDPSLMLLDTKQLRQLFGLSNSEAEIAIGILRGSSLVEIAEDRRVQHETVRGQVKTLLRKMGVANQKQLVADLVLLAATLANLTSASLVNESA
jgi:DNA-binding CsgD family transcriptional regulator